MLSLHIDINDHLIAINVPNSKYAKSFLLRQNWRFERAWLYNSRDELCCVYFLDDNGILNRYTYKGNFI